MKSRQPVTTTTLLVGGAITIFLGLGIQYQGSLNDNAAAVAGGIVVIVAGAGMLLAGLVAVGVKVGSRR